MIDFVSLKTSLESLIYPKLGYNPIISYYNGGLWLNRETSSLRQVQNPCHITFTASCCTCIRCKFSMVTKNDYLFTLD